MNSSQHPSLHPSLHAHPHSPADAHPIDPASSARLIYAIGPSGAGKDSVLDWLLQHGLPSMGQAAQAHRARRTVDVPRQDGGRDELVHADAFDALWQRGELAFAWAAHGQRYGVRRAELSLLAVGGWVMVSGSRAHLPTAALAYPGLTALHITASPATLEQRLLSRGRDTEAVVRQRLQREVEVHPVPGVGRWLQVSNDQSLEHAGRAVLHALGDIV